MHRRSKKHLIIRRLFWVVIAASRRERITDVNHFYREVSLQWPGSLMLNSYIQIESFLSWWAVSCCSRFNSLHSFLLALSKLHMNLTDTVDCMMGPKYCKAVQCCYGEWNPATTWSERQLCQRIVCCNLLCLVLLLYSCYLFCFVVSQIPIFRKKIAIRNSHLWL